MIGYLMRSSAGTGRANGCKASVWGLVRKSLKRKLRLLLVR